MIRNAYVYANVKVGPKHDAAMIPIPIDEVYENHRTLVHTQLRPGTFQVTFRRRRRDDKVTGIMIEAIASDYGVGGKGAWCGVQLVVETKELPGPTGGHDPAEQQTLELAPTNEQPLE